LTLACALIEANQQEKADDLLNSVVSASLASAGGSLNNRPGTGRARSASRSAADIVPTVTLVMPSLEALDGYESDKLCPADPLIYAVMAASFAAQNKMLKARKCLVLCNRSFIEGGHEPHVSSHGAPRRTIVLALAEATLFLFSYGFVRLGSECHKLALQSEASVTAKAAARNMPSNTVPFIKHLLKRANCALLLACPNSVSQQDMAVLKNDRVEAAINTGREAINSSPNYVDISKGYLSSAEALTQARAEPGEICDAFIRAFEASTQAGGVTPAGDRIVPLQCLIDAGKMMVLLGRYEDALGFILPACKIHSSSALLLQAGICCLRLERMDDAEDAFLEANMLDNRNPNVWGYLTLYCLSCSNNRLEEAEKALEQAIRLGLSAPTLLRELATSFMSVDKLLIAEDLIRRTIVLETDAQPENAANYNANSAARSRKLLADILVGQNQAAKAVSQYKAVLADPFADNSTKLTAAESCNALLVSLGRSEEIKAVAKIIETLMGAVNGYGRMQ
jgi:tetratricopeptide (TPR) repeat protein